MTKPFKIPKLLVLQAYKLIKANAGAAGVDQQTIKDFEENLKKNLYKIWNRMYSGSYMPQPVKAVAIPKRNGDQRILVVPTVEDRIAQMVVKLELEPKIEPHFLKDSYGYRPNKSALEAIEVTRQRCWKNNWVLEFDIKGLFDNIQHALIMSALKKHNNNKWIELYIVRWLKAAMQKSDGQIVAKSCGVPQGGVISPMLSNLFMHYAFDKWMERNYPKVEWCRYADDGLVHCKTENQAKEILSKLVERFIECGIEMNLEKTKIIYCKDNRRKDNYPSISFDFLGYTFRPRTVKNSKENRIFTGFNPAISKQSCKEIRQKIRNYQIYKRSGSSLEDIARVCNPKLVGWINYYGKYGISELAWVLQHFTKILVKWAMRKYKRYTRHKIKAIKYIQNIALHNPNLFAHWKIGITRVVV